MIWTPAALASVAPVSAAAVVAASREHGYPGVTEVGARKVVGLPSDIALRALTLAEGERLHDLVATYRQIYRRLARTDLVATQGIEQLLEVLRSSGIRSALVTWDHPSEVDPLMTGLGLARWLDPILTADDGTRPETLPAMARRACRAAGVAADDAIFVAATVHELSAGFGALPVVAAVWGPHAAVDLNDEPTWAVDSLNDLADLLADWFIGRTGPGEMAG